MPHPFFYNIAQICSALNLREVILSPGSRCAPLTIAFNRHPDINIRTISDERSAGYIGLGIAVKEQSPVGLVCTSGTAAANYLPSVAEAFYQQVPMIIFTADRPPEWIDQQDGQAIRQTEIYGSHVKRSYQLPLELDHPDTQWHFQRVISEAIELSKTYPAGPVHINVPFREPFYPGADESISFDKNLRIREVTESKYTYHLGQRQRDTLNHSSNILIVGGQQSYSSGLSALLEACSAKHNIPVIGDVISNLHEIEDVISHPDNFLGNLTTPEDLTPDLLITFGNSVISKSLKLFLRKNPPSHHWHIQQAGIVADPFQTITNVINTTPDAFFSTIQNHAFKTSADYKKKWVTLDKIASNSTIRYLEENSKNEFAVVNHFLATLPENVNLHLANSMSVRYANFIGLANKKGIRVFSNRGTSGIDGCNSTAVGVSMADPEKQNYLLTGDMAFLYDKNAFWHNYPLDNLKILVLNNFGGVIFRMIEGPSQLPELENLFETRQRFSARSTAIEYGFEFYEGSLNNYNPILKEFMAQKGAAIMEVQSEGSLNHQAFRDFKNYLTQSIKRNERA